MKDPLNQRTPDNYGATPIDIDGHKGVIIWKYSPQDYINGEPAPPHWTCGWKVTVNGNQYGDWILIREPSDKLPDGVKQEAEAVLLDHARESIKAI